MIEVRSLSKRYVERLAVDDLTFTVEPGRVTGFLGPNGAGKSTTMRLILGLDQPTTGWATVNGKAMADHDRPLGEVGALLEARSVHTGRTARNHLRVMAATAGISAGRVQQVIDVTGLTDVAEQRVGQFSLGMGQRLGIASALLGDPSTLILDEPVNGLDPDGIRWIRQLLRSLADEGRTVLLSSHLMSEMAVTADHVIVIGRGRLLRDEPMQQFIAEESTAVVRVRSPQIESLAQLLSHQGGTPSLTADDALEIQGWRTDDVGTLAARAGVTVLELTLVSASLEDAYMRLTGEAVEFASQLPMSNAPDASAEPVGSGRGVH